jgi:hypothetical protein
LLGDDELSLKEVVGRRENAWTAWLGQLGKGVKAVALLIQFVHRR